MSARESSDPTGATRNAPPPGRAAGDRVRIGDRAVVTFHRTLRVPEEDQDYPLPPGLGRLPVFEVATYADRVPAAWRRTDAVFIPLYQREALWLGFDGAWWRPNAVVVASGGINVITGEPDRGELLGTPQNYLVVPDQPWLDGFRLTAESVRQFVAAPLGLGETVAEQIGESDPAALRLRVFEPVPGRFPENEPPEPDRIVEGAPLASLEFGFAAGGRIRQRLYQDAYGVASWRGGAVHDVAVYVVNSAAFERITGQPPPPSPVTAAHYAEHGLPWFAFYDEQHAPLAADTWLDRVRTAGQLDPAHRPAPVHIDPAHLVRVDSRRPRPPTSLEAPMPEDILACCIDRLVPDHLKEEADRAMRTEQGPTPELALVRRKKWKNGRRLRIRFLDGDVAVHAKVAAAAAEWMKHANVVFDFGNHADAEIRISFRQPGYWSALGTDALVEDYFPKNQPTMNFQGFTTGTPDAEYQRVVLHEFGHALGCIHEHQNPANPIQWNKEQVYRDLSGPPNNWDRATIDHNMFAKYGKLSTNFSKFDAKSIMLYAFPSSWTRDGMAFPNNRALSEADRAFIGQQYPK